MIKLYGIVNCDTVKKARAWLDAKGIAYEFVDFKKTPQAVSTCVICQVRHHGSSGHRTA